MEKGPETAGGFGRSVCGVVTKIRNHGVSHDPPGGPNGA